MIMSDDFVEFVITKHDKVKNGARQSIIIYCALLFTPYSVTGNDCSFYLFNKKRSGIGFFGKCQSSILYREIFTRL